MEKPPEGWVWRRSSTGSFLPIPAKTMVPAVADNMTDRQPSNSVAADKPFRFTLRGMMRLILYSALIALCVKLFVNSRSPNHALQSLRNGDPNWRQISERGLAKLGTAAVPALLKEL